VSHLRPEGRGEVCRQVTRYFADDQATPGTDETLRAARAVIGAWEGLEDWDTVVDELDRRV
jgi:hypothetical protein